MRFFDVYYLVVCDISSGVFFLYMVKGVVIKHFMSKENLLFNHGKEAVVLENHVQGSKIQL